MMNHKSASSEGGGEPFQQEDLIPPLDMISVTVAPFTGGPFLLRISKRDSVEELKKAVAKKLKVLKDRICLLYRESQLSDGSLEDNFVSDGARITLLPRAETGLLAQKPEQSVMQALESLNDSQVNDFLSGKAPLNLTMRLGDHMMLIQLQLSTVNAAASGANKRSRSSLDSKWAPGTSSSSSNNSNTSSTTGSSSSSNGSYRPKLDTRALAEASKNLTQTLKQLSSEVLTKKPSSGTSESSNQSDDSVVPPSKRPRMSSAPGSSSDSRQQTPPPPSSSPSFTPKSSNAGGSSNPSKSQQQPQQTSSNSSSSSNPKSHSKNGGAIIESMHHHGKGVYSGTFSGTLNPALQDKNGQPKRDITTIIHILNDLLCAQYKNYNSAASSNPSASGRKAETPATASKQAPSSSENPSDTASGRSKMEQLQVTREKMEQLRRVMEERKAQRRARREARAAPYSTSWSLRSSEENQPRPEDEDSSSEPPSASPTPVSSVPVVPSPPAPRGAANSEHPDSSQIYEPETVTA